jgi:hypothetical protein
LAIVRKDGKLGCIDTSGKEIIAHQYDYVDDFREGLARVLKGVKW